MDPWRALLGHRDSMLATLLRHDLTGQRAALGAALDASLAQGRADPGEAACRSLLDELDAVLAVPGAEQPAGPAPFERPAARLAQVVDDLARLPDAPAGWLTGLDRSCTDLDRWERIHLTALRLPAAGAARWRAAVPSAVGTGPWIDLPGRAPVVLIPPSDASPGLRVSPAGAADPDVAGCLGLPGAADVGDPETAELAALATTVIRLTERDPTLELGLASVQHHDLARFDERLRVAYRADLLGRLMAYRQARPGSAESFLALVRIDEAIHSVVHLPVTAPGSWWDQLGERSRSLVRSAQQAHTGVRFQLLTQDYRHVKNQTDNTDIRVRGGRAGEVLACLRLWARVDGEERPGRVIYAG